MYLLDTDVLIDIQREYASALTWFATLPELPAVPGFVVMAWERRNTAEEDNSSAVQRNGGQEHS